MNQQCVDWLRSKLIFRGDVSMDEVRGEARIEGFTKTELKEARKILGVRLHTTEQGYYWYLEV